MVTIEYQKLLEKGAQCHDCLWPAQISCKATVAAPAEVATFKLCLRCAKQFSAELITQENSEKSPAVLRMLETLREERAKRQEVPNP